MLTFASGVLVTSTCHRNPPSLCDTIDTRLQTDDFDSSPRLHSAFGYVRDHQLSSSGDEHEREDLDFVFMHCFCICTIAPNASTQKQLLRQLELRTSSLDSGGQLWEAGSKKQLSTTTWHLQAYQFCYCRHSPVPSACCRLPFDFLVAQAPPTCRHARPSVFIDYLLTFLLALP